VCYSRLFLFLKSIILKVANIVKHLEDLPTPDTHLQHYLLYSYYLLYYIYIHSFIHTHTCIHTYISTHTYTRSCIHTYNKHTYIHTSSIHTYKHPTNILTNIHDRPVSTPMFSLGRAERSICKYAILSRLLLYIICITSHTLIGNYDTSPSLSLSYGMVVLYVWLYGMVWYGMV